MCGKPAILILVCGLLAVRAGFAQTSPLGATINRSGSTITGVTFRVWAPNATGVAVRGQFNSWGETAMIKENATGYWTATVANARPDQEYQYFLRWTGNSSGTWRQDPRALWMRGGNSVIYDHAAFDWETTTRPSIPVDQQVMYEMHIGSFHDPDPNDGLPGTFDDAIARLDYLERLGVNVIALMPVNEFGGDYSWGYNPEHVFAIEAAYGGPDGLKRFVKAAHARGMKVQIDVVHNHWNPPGDGLWQFDGPADIYFPADARRRWTPWGDRPDYAKPEVRRYIQDHIKMLLDEFRIDGFRWDSPQNILGFSWESNSANPDNILPEGKSMMMAINRVIHEQYPARWSIAEDSDLLSVVPDGYYGAGTFYDALRVVAEADSFDGHWQTSFHNVITPQIAATSPDVGEILGKVNGWSEPPGYRVIFTDNHDKSGILNNSKRLANRMDPQSPSGKTARKKTLLNAVLTLTAPGTPMLWMGQEFHATGPFSDERSFDWRAASAQHRIFRAHRDLVTLRKTLPALQNSDLSTAPGGLNEDLDLVVYSRRAGSAAANDIVVFFNFSGQTLSNVNVPFPSSGTWHVRMNTDWPVYGADFNNTGPGSTVSVGENGRAEMSIGAHSAIVFARSPAPAGTALDDADGDGLPDGWEAMTGATDPAGDADGDGVSNLLEYQTGLDPAVPDPVMVAGTFNGWKPAVSRLRPAGAADELDFIYWSRAAGSEQAKFIFNGGWYGLAGQPDLGPSDNVPFSTPPGAYVRLSFNARTKTPVATMIGTMTGSSTEDADNDGMDDRWERFHGVVSPTANPDTDAFDNLQEFRRGSDPNAWNRPVIALAGLFNDWNASATPMVFSGNTRWTIDLLFRAGTAGEFKFTDGSWSNTWGESQAGGGDDNIRRVFDRNGIYRFVFDEADASWSVVREETDANGDGIPDAWVVYHGLTGSAALAEADPDGDGITNRGEFRRFSNPLVIDRLSLVGNGGPLSWSPDASASRMAWSESRERWEWTGVFPGGALEFKFATGPGWEGINYGPGQLSGTASAGANGNLSTTLAAARYRFFFDETTGIYGIGLFPVSAQWREVHSLPEQMDWSADADDDGAPDLFEFALGGNPVDRTDGPALQAFSSTNISGIDRLVLQWLERTDAGPSLVVTPVFSSDLVAGWQPLTASNAPARLGDPAHHQRKEVSVPLDGTAGFLRLRVSGP